MSVDWPDFNDLWDYNDPASTEQKFRELIPAAQAAGDPSYTLQLLTQIARTLGLQGKFEEAHVVLDEVEEQMAGGDLVEVRYLLERGRAFNSDHQPETAVPLFDQAVILAKNIEAYFYAVDALHMLGIAAPPAERLDWNLQAIAYAEDCGDERAARWLGSLYNNTGWTLFDEERYLEALEMFQKAEVFRRDQGTPDQIRIARWCVAKTQRVLGDVEVALATQRDLEQGDESDGFIKEEIGECLLALGEAEAARPYFRNAYELLSQLEWVAEDETRMQRLKSLGE
jgi:tetratricopeptide (TPR) repeat protein